MSKIKLELPDGKVLELEKGVTGMEVAQSIGPGLAKAALALKLDGSWFDLRAPIENDAKLQIVTNKSPEAGEVIRHSAEHVMAEAVSRIWPEVQIDVGRTDHSEKFQYDFKVEKPFTESDLEKIEKKANEILAEKSEFKRKVVSREEAVKFFADAGQHLKVERIKDIPGDEDITLYSHGNFTDLCRGPHVQNTAQIGVFKITENSAAYWKGDEKNEILQRVYGTAFSSKKEYDAYIHLQEEAKKRDHRKLGKELDLFSVSDEVGPGLILWHPKGAKIRYLMEEFWRTEHLKNGYEFAVSPHIAKKKLWETSGHTDFYRENMFGEMQVDDLEYMAKPMNCPFHVQIFKSRLRSYRDLPLRMAELGTVYRYERSGVLHGLLRVRGFTQDDAHLFVTPSQLREEIVRVLEFITHMFSSFGFDDYEMFLSTRPEKSVGSDDDWALATSALEDGLKELKLDYQADPGEGVFYGPKIDIKVKDTLGRGWQCATLQADFNLPQRFGLEFVDQDGTKKTPIMLHRALLGSIERFFGILIEHYAGAFPLWLAPTQVILLPITDAQLSFAKEVEKTFQKHGLRVELDARNEKLGQKIRNAQLQKVPYMIVLGEKEVDSKTLSVRSRTGEQIASISVDAFIDKMKKEAKVLS